MDNKKLYHFGAISAFGLAASTIMNGVAFFTGPDQFFALARILIVIFAFGFFPALYTKGREAHPGWAAWAMSFAYISIAAEFIRYVANPEFHSANLFFGGLGTMLLTYNILGLRHNLWPKALAWLGIVMAVLLLGVIPSQWDESLAFLNTVGALGAVVLYPIWLVWLGRRLRAE